MTVYAYKVLSEGLTRRGTLSAESPRAARDALRAQGLRVRDLRELSTAPSWAGWSKALRRLTLSRYERQVVSFYGELSTLLSAGLPLLEALESIAAQHRGLLRDRLLLLRERVSNGVPLAEAMAPQDDLFDPLSVRLVDVGERSGALSEVLAQAAAYRGRSAHFRGKVSTALIYPALVVTTGVGVTLFLMAFVVPKLLQSLTEAGKTTANLPVMTRAVKALSDALMGYWPWMLVVLILFVAVVAYLRGRPRMRIQWDRFILRVPLLGELLIKQAVVRLSVTVATLTRSGVPLVEALRIARASLRNTALHDAVAGVEAAVIAGRDLGPAMDEAGVLPRPVVQVFAVGQASGRLDVMLERLASDYDQQVERATQRLLALLEPVLILLLAVFVGIVVLSVILPYLEAGDVL